MNIEQQYLTIMKDILENGSLQNNRTAEKTLMIPSATLKHDLSEGFPLFTTRKLFYKPVVGELLGFLRGYTSAADFRSLGCNFWNQNANETQSWLDNPHRKGEDDLGTLAYSVGWTKCPNGFEPDKPINQVAELIHTLKTNPESRRMVVSAWHPELFPSAALPPCHVMWGVNVDQQKQTLNIWWTQRSADFYLGIPSNIASYATLAHMLCAVSGYKPGIITGFLVDVHLYESQWENAKTLVNRKPFDLPELYINYRPEIGDDISKFNVDDFSFGETYVCHPPLSVKMVA